MLQRFLKVFEITNKKSIFLLGPRRTGKSALLRTGGDNISYWDLLDSNIFRILSSNPAHLRQTLLSLPVRPQVVVIDEVQKLPFLLDEVQLLMEQYGFRFILSGSSARALRRRGVNLLAGRAHVFYFHPFTFAELGVQFDLLRVLNYGTLPSVYLSEEPLEELNQYVGTYLAEEIANEGFVRQLPAFSRFLEVAAMCNGQQINFTNIASDAQVKRSTVVDWFDILKDTLIAHEVPIWQESRKRKAVNTSKYYFFDVGVARTLAMSQPLLHLQGAEIGAAFEHFIFHELRTSCDYKVHKSLHTWRTSSQFEVDFILDGVWAIEVKAKNHISPSDLKGLRALKEEHICTRYTIVALVPYPLLLEDGIEVLPYTDFLKAIWNHENEC